MSTTLILLGTLNLKIIVSIRWSPFSIIIKRQLPKHSYTHLKTKFGKKLLTTNPEPFFLSKFNNTALCSCKYSVTIFWSLHLEDTYSVRRTFFLSHNTLLENKTRGKIVSAKLQSYLQEKSIIIIIEHTHTSPCFLGLRVTLGKIVNFHDSRNADNYYTCRLPLSECFCKYGKKTPHNMLHHLLLKRSGFDV